MTINPLALDRFSFMVKKSLAKINGSGATVGSSGSLDAVGMAVSTLATGIADVSSQNASLSGALVETNTRIATLQVTSVGTGSVKTVGASSITSEDQSVLDMILALAE